MVRSGYECTFDQIRVFSRHPLKGIGRAYTGNRALVAVVALVVADLQVEGAVPKGGTPLNTFTASVAKLFIDGIFEEGFLNKLAPDGTCRAELVFGPGGQVHAVGLEVPTTQVAIAAHGIGVYALDGRGGLDTFGGAPPALGAFEGIDLPDILA
jgi:hypothetical protein